MWDSRPEDRGASQLAYREQQNSLQVFPRFRASQQVRYQTYIPITVNKVGGFTVLNNYDEGYFWVITKRTGVDYN